MKNKNKIIEEKQNSCQINTEINLFALTQQNSILFIVIACRYCIYDYYYYYSEFFLRHNTTFSISNV